MTYAPCERAESCVPTHFAACWGDAKCAQHQKPPEHGVGGGFLTSKKSDRLIPGKGQPRVTLIRRLWASQHQQHFSRQQGADRAPVDVARSPAGAVRWAGRRAAALQVERRRVPAASAARAGSWTYADDNKEPTTLIFSLIESK